MKKTFKVHFENKFNIVAPQHLYHTLLCYIRFVYLCILVSVCFTHPKLFSLSWSKIPCHYVTLAYQVEFCGCNLPRGICVEKDFMSPFHSSPPCRTLFQVTGTHIPNTITEPILTDLLTVTEACLLSHRSVLHAVKLMMLVFLEPQS